MTGLKQGMLSAEWATPAESKQVSNQHSMAQVYLAQQIASSSSGGRLAAILQAASSQGEDVAGATNPGSSPGIIQSNAKLAHRFDEHQLISMGKDSDRF